MRRIISCMIVLVFFTQLFFRNERVKAIEDLKSQDLILLLSDSSVDVKCFVKEEWDNGKMYNIILYIYNNSSEIIHDWELKFKLNGDIVNIWNAHIKCKEKLSYTIKNDVWNQDIMCYDMVSIGLTVKADSTELPNDLSVISHMDYVCESDYRIDYQVYSDWKSGYSAAITISNISDSIIEDWQLEFDFDRKINEMWNGNYQVNDNNHYLITNLSYNQNIMPGESVIVGFNGTGGDIEISPKN